MSDDARDVTFGTLHPDGGIENVRTIPRAAILACRFAILSPSHYRDDGTCKCDDPEEQARLIRDWDYTEEDFR